MRSKIRSHTLSIALALGLLNACLLPAMPPETPSASTGSAHSVHPQGEGSVSLQLIWPFRTQNLPPEAETLEIRISGPDFSPDIVTVVRKHPGSTGFSTQMRLKVPAGANRNVEVVIKDGQDYPVARGQGSVTISPNSNAVARIEMKLLPASVIVPNERTEILEPDDRRIEAIFEDRLVVSASAAQQFQVGDMLAGTRGEQGFSRKITSISQQGDQVILHTELASLAELFDKFEINGLRDEWLQEVDSSFGIQQEASTSAHVGLELGGGRSIVFEVENTGQKVLDPDIEFKEVVWDFRDFNMDIVIGYLRLAPEVRVKYKAIVKTTAEATNTARLSLIQEHQQAGGQPMFKAKWCVPIGKGCVPVFAKAQLYSKLEGSLRKSRSVMTLGGIEGAFQGKVGVEIDTYNRRTNWIQYFHENSQIIEPDISAQATFEAKAKLTPLEGKVTMAIGFEEQFTDFVGLDAYSGMQLSLGTFIEGSYTATAPVNNQNAGTCNYGVDIGIGGGFNLTASMQAKLFNLEAGRSYDIVLAEGDLFRKKLLDAPCERATTNNVDLNIR